MSEWNIGEVATEWLRLEFPNRNTRKVYRSALRQYMSANTITDFDAYLKQSRLDNHVMDGVRIFLQSLHTKSPLTQRQYLIPIKQFFKEHDIEIDDAVLKRTQRRRRMRRVHPITQDRIPTREELRTIMDYLPVAGRAFFLLLVSSGVRLGEALGLEVSDLDLDADPPRALIRRSVSKGGYGERTIFISTEARDAIQNWLKVKPILYKRGMTATRFNEKLIFDMSSSAFRQMWNAALEKAGLNTKDDRTGHHVLHIHTLRKFFRSMVRMNPSFVEVLMGHFSNQLDYHYLRVNLDEVAQEYLTHMKNVSVYGVQMDERIVQVETENRVLKNELQQLQTQIEHIQTSRSASDDTMNQLFNDAEFRRFLEKKLRDIS